MTFMKNDSMSFIQLLNSSKLDVPDDGVDEELKQSNCDISTIEKVGSSNGEEVCNSGADLPEQFPGARLT